MDIQNLSPEVAFGVPSGAAALFFIIKRMILKTASLDTTKAAVEAEGEVIDILRDEVTRMSEANKLLHTELQKFHAENIQLRKEITLLQSTIEDLTARLNILDTLRAECTGCEHNKLPDRRTPVRGYTAKNDTIKT